MRLRDPKGRWSGLKSVVRIEPTRRHGDAVSTEARPYLSSLPADAPLLARTIRGHWGIESRFHWALDVVFREDLGIACVCACANMHLPCRGGRLPRPRRAGQGGGGDGASHNRGDAENSPATGYCAV